MDCEQADNLMAARVDRETLAAEDEAALDAHLATCAACREAERALRVQDAELLRAFAPRRDAAARVADHVARRMATEARPAGSARWRTMVTAGLAAAAGFLLAAVLLRPWDAGGDRVAIGPGGRPTESGARPWTGPGPTTHIASPVGPANPVRPALATLSLATGPVEVKPAGSGKWRAMPTGGPVAAGDIVRTGPKVRCEFVMHEGSQVRLNNATELRFRENRLLDLNAGQLWSTVVRADDPFRVQLAGATVTALGTQFDLRHTAGGDSVLTVVEGATRVRGAGDAGAETVVRSGERLTVSGSGRAGRPEQVRNLVTATRWVHEILLMKGRGNDELTARVDDLFAQIGRDKMAFMLEHEVRALGDHCVVPLTRYLQSDRSRGEDEKRRTAARILSDVAQPWSAGELIELLDDRDGDVRHHAATALHRVTGETLGRTADEWRAARAPLDAWRAWWAENKERFPGAP